MSRISLVDRRALLRGTALGSTLLVSAMLMPIEAHAQDVCDQGMPPGPIMDGSVGSIICVNTADRTDPGNLFAITLGAVVSIDLTNSGRLFGQIGGIATGAGGSIDIDNSGRIDAGFFGITAGAVGSIDIDNSGRIDAGLFGITAGAVGSIDIDNSGRIDAGLFGIQAGAGGSIVIANRGEIGVGGGALGIGIDTQASGPIGIANNAGITVNALVGIGIQAQSGESIGITNNGDVVVKDAVQGFGIVAGGGAGPINVINNGGVAVSGPGNGFGVIASGDGPIGIGNSGGVGVVAGGGAAGIAAFGFGPGSISIVNSGDVAARGGAPGPFLDPRATDVGIGVASYGGGAISIVNSGNVAANGAFGVGIGAASLVPGAPIGVVNSGFVSGSAIAVGVAGNGAMTVTNLAGGSISGGFAGAINAKGAGSVSIFNAGLITGFVDLTDNDDLFTNQSGGVFQAQGTSLFGMGNDLFTNQIGGVVDTANNPFVNETVRFEGLETFQNFGTISLVDGAPGDLFTISNTPMMTDLNYVAGSFLAVDAFLGGPGSSSDIFRIDGNVAGVTDVIVNNTGPAIGVFNPVGITVVQVRGNVDPSAFRLANGPIDTGFFNFDLFTENDGTFTNFELRSFPGAGAQLLPQLVTAAQDIWHQTSDTWFDRSADLRTQLWRNGGSVSGMPGAMYLGGGSAKDGAVVEQGGLSPAVWARVSHGELEQDGSARTNAFGRSFEFNLDRELYIIDVQSGVDFALQGVMNPSDVLLLSVFGGGVSANLQYDQLDRRRFDYDGGQVGVAATYLSGGLFVDALFNAQFLEVDPNALGFAESLDSNAYGFRIDSGYRFGMGSGGLFLEPLLTLAYVNSDLDGFSFAGNTVSFQDEDSLRGRVGLRAGTSLWIEAVRFEPFVIASYWGELSDDDNRATLVSSGTRFGFRDEREDGWGEVSLGTNTFLAGNNALSAFSKIDIIFGDDTEGYIAQGGFRVQW